MKVSTLISKLEKMDPDRDVVLVSVPGQASIIHTLDEAFYCARNGRLLISEELDHRSPAERKVFRRAVALVAK